MSKAAQTLPEWDLSNLYPSIDSPKVKTDLGKAQKLVDKFCKNYSSKMNKISAKSLGEAISDYEKIEDLLGKLYSYADLEYARNMADPLRGQFAQNMTESITAMASQLLFFTLEINKIPEKKLKAKIKSSPDVAHYSPWLRDVRSLKPYQLSDELEKLLLEKRSTTQSWSRLFDESIARMRFSFGTKQLTSAEALDLLSHKDAAKRKQAAKSIGAEFEKQQDHFALITNTLAKDKFVEDTWRGFPSPISARNVDNAVEDEVVDALITTVQANYKQLSHRYYKWKAKQFGKKSIDYWDRNAPLPSAADKTYGWDESVELVQSAYHAFSPKLAKVGKKFFDNNWIDAPVRAGKAPGAFAHPTVPSANPYLLLNFQGKTRDVMTLAHELGHGVHQLLSANQGALMANTPLTLAETASVFGEMLTFQEILRREKNPQRKQFLIASKIEDMLNTVVRQTSFCEFERQVHEARRAGELTASQISDIWMAVQKDSLGPSITLHDEYRHYWMYIPHFIHSAFYVYAYAFGDCLVNSLYSVYLEESAKGERHAKAFEKKYLEMLSAGGTLRHKKLLKPFGLNAAQPDFWQQGLNVISHYIDQLD